MEHEGVEGILLHVGTLDIEVIEVLERHDHDVCVHLHHEGDEALLAGVVRKNARMALRVLEDLVVRVSGDVVDADVRVREKPLDGTLEVTPEAATL